MTMLTGGNDSFVVSFSFSGLLLLTMRFHLKNGLKNGVTNAKRIMDMLIISVVGWMIMSLILP
ncbi:hypothetical protein AS203_05680 [Hoylesella enoeca]|uniref:Uncharacterized protein n=1 Tax=Hoylesella enoeca TaxID=76123 RepID=A0A0S2KKM9_9BACT|nr:hypothetical protein AS203_05680 [Hoylesella enoeca]